MRTYEPDDTVLRKCKQRAIEEHCRFCEIEKEGRKKCRTLQGK